MATSTSRRYLVAAWLVGLGALVAALERDAPLFLNLGPGDAPFARGFRGGWERDGLNQSGMTAFHWTDDGARLEFPVVVHAGRLSARLRLARFAASESEIRVFAGDRLVEQFTQPPRGFALRSLDLGDARGPLMLRFRSEAAGGDSLGVALDWVEVTGAERVTPRRALWPGIAAWLFGVPTLLAIALGGLPGLAAAAFAAIAGAIAIGLDRLGGLVAIADAGVPALLVVAFLAGARRLFARYWPEQFSAGAAPLLVACVAALGALLALAQPFFYYPDLDTHARFVAAIRADPFAAFDPREFQTRTGAWTRSIGARRVAFPYSPAFHVAAWPLAVPLGERVAIDLVAVSSLGLTLLLAFGMARAAGLEVGGACLAAALLASLPVTSSRLTLALYPTLFGQMLESLLGLHVVRRFAHLQGARDAAALATFFTLALGGYTGSLFNVTLLALAFAALSAAGGEARAALRLLAAYAVAAAIVGVVLYARFLPVLLRDVLPYARAAAPGAGEASSGPAVRLLIFYGLVYPTTALLGLLLLCRRARVAARRYLGAALGSGFSLLALRYAAPALFRDAKEVEMLALPIAVLTAVAIDGLWRSRPIARLAAVTIALGLMSWGAWRAITVYAERFVAIDRLG